MCSRITESWLVPASPALADGLSDPLTEVQAEARRLAVTRQRHLDDVITYLEASYAI